MQIVIIILALAIGAIWLLVKVAEAISGAVDQATKSLGEAAARRKQDRRSRLRDRLRKHFYVQIPTELDDFEKKCEAVRAEFERLKKLTHWAAHPPVWKKVEFYAIGTPQKHDGYDEMNIEDVNTILNPNLDSETWSYKELQIINRDCEYPSVAPASKLDKLTDFPSLSANLKAAIFEFDPAHVNKKDADRYFLDEQTKVLAHNNWRTELIKKNADMNSEIEEWNRRNRLSWQKYVAESKKMEEVESIAFRRASELYTSACREETRYFKSLLEGYKGGEKHSVVTRVGFVLDDVRLPGSVPHTWEVDFDQEQRIAVVDIGLPDVVHHPPHKTVVLKFGRTKKPLNQNEKKDVIPKVHPSILLRIAYEIFRNDIHHTIKLLVLNGWVRFDNPATGMNTKAYTASLMVEREQITNLNLSKIDPIVAFNNLHGKSAGRLVEIVPIEPILSLNRKDSRFVNAKEVLKDLGAETNLAAMDWQDFEHLIRELFEKEFSGRGAEVKITQASRDRGVDAIVFDPDPIHGGKYVIQAKRYTNTVDVSAVRDLCAVVKKEGASRGILVTTSTYGADAYAFANNEPVTLLNGAELLGLLKKHGYTFRINLQEARRSI